MTDIQVSIVALVIQLLTALLAYQYIVHRVDGVCRVNMLFAPKFVFETCLIMVVGYFAAAFIFLRGYLLGDDSFMRALMNAEVMIWLFTIGYIDFRERIIPNSMIGWGLLLWLVLTLVDVFLGGTSWRQLLVFSAIGGAVCGGLLCVIALLVKSALGMGDAKMFFVLGLLYGLSDAYGILLFSVIIMGLVSIILLIAKKATTKTQIPMAPFVVIGYMLSILAGM